MQGRRRAGMRAGPAGFAGARAVLDSRRMVRDIQAIPPAPRRVRWRAVTWHRWPLALLALALAGYGGLFTWMLFLGMGGVASEDVRLDAESIAHQGGEVVAIQQVGIRGEGGRLWDEVTARYPLVPAVGNCWVPSGSVQPGQQVVIEALPGTDEHVFRIRGGRRDLLRWWLRPLPWLRLLVLPGAVLGLSWFLLALRLRYMLRHGDVGIAEVLACRRVRGVLPAMLAVEYGFRDHRAAACRGRHWVPRRSALGQRLRHRERGQRLLLPVLHSRRWPQFSRLALPGDFAPLSPSAAPQETMRP